MDNYVTKFFRIVGTIAGVYVFGKLISDYARADERKKLGLTDSNEDVDAFNVSDTYFVKDGNVYKKVTDQ